MERIMNYRRKFLYPYFLIGNAKKILFFFIVYCVFLFNTTTLFCRQVDSTVVKKVAATFVNSKFPGFVVASISKLCDDKAQTIGYIVNLTPQGFVVLSNRTEIYPIILYSQKGKMSTNNSIANIPLDIVKWDLEARTNSLKLEPAILSKSFSTNNLIWQDYANGIPIASDSREIYGPLLKTRWNQEGFYNKFCPYDPKLLLGVIKRRSVVGCVATAASQIINYWQFPKQMSLVDDDKHDRYSFTTSGVRINVPDDAANYDFPSFSELNAQLLSIKYDGSQTEIAYLCFGVGVKLKMNYSAAGSATYQSAKFFRDLGYGSATVSSWNSSYNNVINNIEEGWPVQVSIYNDKNEGHSVVFDGYNTSEKSFHVNMGWSGTDDGWYIPPALDTFYHFNVMRDVVYDICPYPGWSQWGADCRNSCKTPYKIPLEDKTKWSISCDNSRSFSGLVIGNSGNIITTCSYNNSSTNNPSLWIIREDGVKIDELVIPNETGGLNYLAQSTNGEVFVTSDLGNLYKINISNKLVQKIFVEPDNQQLIGPVKVDEDGFIYVSTFYKTYCLSPNGNIIWSYTYPNNAMDLRINPAPAIDASRNKVYAACYDASSKTSYFICLNRYSGIALYLRSFTDVVSASDQVSTASVDNNGHVYFCCNKILYALNSNNNFEELWKLDVHPSRIIIAPAIGITNCLYVPYWNTTLTQQYIASINSTNGRINWQMPFTLGINDNVENIFSDSHNDICFTISRLDNYKHYNETVYCYRDLGNSYQYVWQREFNTSGGTCAFGPNTYYSLPSSGYGHTITAITESTGNQSFPDYTNNNPPDVPVYTNPTDGIQNADTNLAFSWNCTDPDGNNLKYSFYLGYSSQMLGKYMSDLSSNSIVLHELSPDSVYLWSVSATDGQSVTQGPIFSFRTKTTLSPTKLLKIESVNPSSGVNIKVSPIDNSMLGDDTTSFTRKYNQGTIVTLTAPLITKENNFKKWQRNGHDYLTSNNITFSMDSNYTFTAIYQGNNNNILLDENFNSNIAWTTKVYQGTGSFNCEAYNNEQVCTLYMDGSPGVVYAYKRIDKTIPAGSILTSRWFYETSGLYTNSENSDGGYVRFIKSITSTQPTNNDVILELFAARDYPMRQWNEKDFIINKEIPAGNYISIGGAVWPSYIKNHWDYIRIVSSSSTNEADLAVSMLSFSPPNLHRNEHPQSVSFNLQNNGPANMESPNTRVRINFYLSKNSVLGDRDDQPMGYVDKDLSLSSKQSTQVILSSSDLTSVSIPADIDSGKHDYYVFVQVKHQAPSSLVDPDLNSGYTRTTITDVAKDESQIPVGYLLHQNFPNPFNPTTTINYSIPQESFVIIKVYDVLGHEITTLVNGEKPAGNYEVKFSVETRRGESLPSGIYFYSLQAGSYYAVKKLVVLK